MLDNRILYSSFLENIYFPRNRLRECDNCNKNENVNRESKDVASKSIEYQSIQKIKDRVANFRSTDVVSPAEKRISIDFERSQRKRERESKVPVKRTNRRGN